MDLHRPVLRASQLIALGALLLIVGSLTRLDAVSDAGWLVLAGVAALGLFLGVRRVLRTLLWSVGRRLLVSYLLLGVLPIPFLLGITYAVAYTASGQMAARRVADEVRILLHDMEDVAEDAARIVSSDRDPTARLEALAATLEGAGILYRAAGRAPVGVGPWPAEELLPWDGPFRPTSALGVLEDGRHFFFVLRSLDRGNLLVYLPADPHAREILARRTRLGLHFPFADREPEKVDANDVYFAIGNGAELRETISEEPPEDGAPVPPPKVRTWSVEIPEPPSSGDGFLAHPTVYWPQFFDLPYLRWRIVEPPSADGVGDPESASFSELGFPYLVRTSIAAEVLELFDAFSMDESNTSMTHTVGEIIRAMAVVVLVVFGSASLLAGFLVFRIARATHRLHRGIEALEQGHFDHRVRLRGHDQLSALVQGFNEMVEHLESGVSERAERQAIDRQLEVARDLQQSLLPTADQSLPGLSTAVGFEPAAAIGGDFYHFDDRGDGRAAVAVADVSGHGLGTGIVMAAAQSLLATLSEDAEPIPRMLQRLDRQLHRLTDRRTFVTLAHCLFDPHAERVTVCCAGHLYPYRVGVDGSVTAVGSACRPLGLTLGGDLKVREVSAPLVAGDLWVLLSDGTVEATAEDGNLFGFDRLEALLRHCAGKDARSAEAILRGALDRFVDGRSAEDDRTLIVIEVLEPDPAAPKDRGGR